MSPEKTPKLSDPRERADMAQAEVERTLETIRDEVEMWELLVNNARDTGDEAAFFNRQNEGMESLDAQWPFDGDSFLVTGTWRRTRVVNDPTEKVGMFASSSQISWKMNEEEVFEVATSLGFGWYDVGERMRMGLVFDLDTIVVNKPYMGAFLAPKAIAFLDSANVSFIKSSAYGLVGNEENSDDTKAENPKAETPEDPGKSMRKTLELYDIQARMYLNRPEFLRLTHKRQQALLRQLVEEASQKVTGPSVEVYIQANITQAYERIRPSEAYGFQTLQSTEPQTIIGQLMGVSVLEMSILDREPIRDRRQFINPQAGLCLMVERVQENEPARVLYLPLSTCDDLMVQSY